MASSTSLGERKIRQLKLEEARGMATIAAVSQPSSPKRVCYYTDSSKTGFGVLECQAGPLRMNVILHTLSCIIGRDQGLEVVSDEIQNKQFLGLRTLEVLREENCTVTITRPAGLPPMAGGNEEADAVPWTVFDSTRIAFSALKKLSRTHFAIAWNAEKICWEAICLSANGINVNDTRLREGETSRLQSGTVITAATQSVRIAVNLANTPPAPLGLAS